MSKKNKKQKTNDWDLFVYPPMMGNSAKEGDLRFHQRTVEKRIEKWWGYDYKDLGSSPKVLQRFDGKEWKDVPFEREYIEI